MSQRTSRRLRLQRETLRRLASGDLAQVAGGYFAARCTYEKSGCYGQTYTYDCAEQSWGGSGDSCMCI